MMEITITHTTEIIDGKGYPLTVTRIIGLQEIHRKGETVWVSAVTYHDSREGCTSCFRRYEGPIPQEGEAANKLPPLVEARLKEIAAQGMLKREGIA